MKNLSFMVAAILVLASAPKVLVAAPAAMAVQAATEDVVDYTFDWTQQSAYNMWAPDAVKPNISVSAEDGLSVKNETVAEHFYDIQYMIGSNVPLLKGTDYSIKIVMKGSAAGHATVAMGTWGSPGTRVEFTDQYATYTLPCTSAYEGNGFILMQSGDFVGTISVKSVEVVHSEKATTRYTYNLATVDYTADGATEAGGWCQKGFESKIVDGACVISHGETTNPWEAQVNFGNVYPKGAKIQLTMEAKGSVEGSIKAGLQNPNNYQGCGEFEDFNLTTDYQTITKTVTCSGDNAQRLLLSVGQYNGTISIKNVKIEALDVPQETVTISPSGYSTYAAYYPVAYSDLGLKAYTVKLNGDKTSITMTEVEGVVPAGVAVLLQGVANKDYALTKADDWKNVTSDLKMSDGTITSTDKANVYGLATVDGQDGFYKASSAQKIPAKCGYLEVAKTAGAAFFSLGDITGNTTGIADVKAETVKADAQMYNLAGQKVGKGYKGIVIKNGKKMILK